MATVPPVLDILWYTKNGYEIVNSNGCLFYLLA